MSRRLKLFSKKDHFVVAQNKKVLFYSDMQSMTDDQKAEYLFNQAQHVAVRKRNLSIDACEFLDMDHDSKIDFMNDVVFPAWEKAGSPEPYTAECLAFTDCIFS